MKQNASAGILTSSIASGLDILKPEEYLRLIKVNNAGLESKAFMFTHTLGFSAPTGRSNYSHTEKGLSNAILQVQAHAIGVISTPVTYTLTGDAATYVYVRVNDMVMFTNHVRGVVTAVDYTAKTFTVTPATGVTLPQVIVGTNDFILVYSRGFGESSTIGEPASTLTYKLSGQTQLIKEKVSTTGTALSDMTWVDFGAKGFYSVQLLDGEMKVLRWLEGSFLHGKQDNTITDPNSTKAGKVLQSQGLLDAATAGVSALNPPTTYSDFDSLSEALISTYVSSTTPIYSMLGLKAYQGIQALFFGTGDLKDSQNFLTNASDDKLFKASETYGAFANFKYFNSLYTYMFELNQMWSDPTSYGAEGFNFNETALFVPIYKVKDGMTGKTFGTMGTRYKEANGLNRKFMIGTNSGFGSSNGATIGELDNTSTYWLAEIGNQFMGTHQYILT